VLTPDMPIDSDVRIGEFGNKVLCVTLNEEFIEYINYLDRLEGNVMILDFLMNILADENVAGFSWSLKGIDVGNDEIAAFSLLGQSSYEVSIIGDCNGDGKVNGIDVNLMRRVLSGNGGSVDPFAVDLNSDGLLNAKDSYSLKTKIALG